MPQLMALREAVMGLQRTGLPPHLLFSDRDFTADDYDELCRLDEMVESKKGASPGQLAALPTQTAPPGGLLGEGGERLSCSVCLEEFEEGQALCTLPQCLHKYHAGCVQTWLKHKATCPALMVRRGVHQDWGGGASGSTSRPVRSLQSSSSTISGRTRRMSCSISRHDSLLTWLMPSTYAVAPSAVCSTAVVLRRLGGSSAAVWNCGGALAGGAAAAWAAARHWRLAAGAGRR